MAASPAFATIPRLEVVEISTANANRDGTGTLGTLITGVDAGTIITKIMLKARVTTTAGMIRLFLSKDGGTTKYLIREQAVSAVTPSATVSAWESEIDLSYLDFILPDTSSTLYISTEKAEAIVCTAIGADLT